MFDLSRELRNWKVPFRASHLYSSDDLNELEAHLLDTIEAELEDGASQEDAFWMALARVGDEPTLRKQYQLGWKELNPIKKFWRLLTKETTGFETSSRKLGYASARVISLLIGLAAPFYLFVAVVFLVRGLKIIEFGRPVYEQGVFFTLLMGLQGLFSWLPFRRWTGKVSDWMRLIYAAACIYIALVFLLYHPASYTGLGGLVGVLSMSTVFSIGPVLWLLQTVSRRPHKVDYDDLLFARD
jgi:hypothetical protein